MDEWMRRKGFTDEWYHDSWCKWKGKLWERLEELLDEYIDAGEDDPQRKVWMNHIWTTCSYCKVARSCSSCPLFQINACYTELETQPEPTLTDIMYKAWIDGDKEKFVEVQGKMLRDLFDTRWFCM